MPSPRLFTLSFKPNNRTTETLEYNTLTNHLSYVTEVKSRISCFSKHSTLTYGRPMVFQDPAQQEAFIDALENKDLMTALDISKKIEPDDGTGQFYKHLHPTRVFFERFLDARRKIDQHNNEFLVTHGIASKQVDVSRFDVNNVEPEVMVGVAPS